LTTSFDGNGTPNFDRIRYRRHDASVFLYAFDLIELNGDDLRRDPLEVRKATLASVLSKTGPGLRLNEHLEHEDGEVVFRHACKLGLEGIVSKRKGSPYRSGRSPDWLKMKNPEAPTGRFARAYWRRQLLANAAIAASPDPARQRRLSRFPTPARRVLRLSISMRS
jgi:ATP dependent DNA ligase domain